MHRFLIISGRWVVRSRAALRGAAMGRTLILVAISVWSVCVGCRVAPQADHAVDVLSAPTSTPAAASTPDATPTIPPTVRPTNQPPTAAPPTATLERPTLQPPTPEPPTAVPTTPAPPVVQRPTEPAPGAATSTPRAPRAAGWDCGLRYSVVVDPDAAVPVYD